MNVILDEEYRNELLTHFSNAVKQVQMEQLAKQPMEDCPGDHFIVDNDSPSGQILCASLEMIFMHGLKERQPGFWEMACYFCRSEVVQTIRQLRHVKTDIGKGRAWIYIALNENELEGYLQSFLMDLPHMYRYYQRYAMLCSSQVSVIQTLISGLEYIKFKLQPDVPHLDFRIAADKSRSRTNTFAGSGGTHVVDKNRGSVVHIDATPLTKLANKGKERAASFIKEHLQHANSTQPNVSNLPMKVIADHSIQEKSTAFVNGCNKCAEKNALICLCIEKNIENELHSADVRGKFSLGNGGVIHDNKHTVNDNIASWNTFQEGGVDISLPRKGRFNPFDRESASSVDHGSHLVIASCLKRFDKQVTITDSPIKVTHRTKKTMKKRKVSDSGSDASAKSEDANLRSDIIHRPMLDVDDPDRRHTKAENNRNITELMHFMSKMSQERHIDYDTQAENITCIDVRDTSSNVVSDGRPGASEHSQSIITTTVMENAGLYAKTNKLPSDTVQNKLQSLGTKLTKAVVSEDCNIPDVLSTGLDAVVDANLCNNTRPGPTRRERGDSPLVLTGGCKTSSDAQGENNGATSKVVVNMGANEGHESVKPHIKTRAVVSGDEARNEGDCNIISSSDSEYNKIIYAGAMFEMKASASDEPVYKMGDIEDADDDTTPPCPQQHSLPQAVWDHENVETAIFDKCVDTSKGSANMEDVEISPYSNQQLQSLSEILESSPLSSPAGACEEVDLPTVCLGKEKVTIVSTDTLEHPTSKNKSGLEKVDQASHGLEKSEITDADLAEDCGVAAAKVIMLPKTEVQDETSVIMNETLAPIFFNEPASFTYPQSAACCLSNGDASSAVEARDRNLSCSQEHSCKPHHKNVSHPSIVSIDNNLRLDLLIEVLKDESEAILTLFHLSTGHSEGSWTALYLLFSDCFIYFMRSGDGSCPFQVDHVVSYEDLDYISTGYCGQAMQFVFYKEKPVTAKGDPAANQKVRRKMMVDTADEKLTDLVISALSEAFALFAKQRGVVKVRPSIFHNSKDHEVCLQKYMKSEGLSGMIDMYNLVHWEDPDNIADEIASNVMIEGSLDYKVHSFWGSSWKPAYFVLTTGILYQYKSKESQKPDLSYDLKGNNCSGCKRLRSNSAKPGLEFEVIFQREKLELRGHNDIQVTEWLQSLCLTVSLKQTATETKWPRTQTFESLSRDALLPCSIIVSSDNILLFHEDQLTGFCRTLAKTESHSIMSVHFDWLRNACEIMIASSAKWIVFFSSTHSMKKFDHLINNFSKAPNIATVTGESQQIHLREGRALLDNRWTRPDNLRTGRQDNEEFIFI